MGKPYARSFRPSRNLIIYSTHLLTWKPKRAHQQNVHLDMREAMKTYAWSPVHSLCASCPSPPKDWLTKTANLETKGANKAKSILGYARSHKNICAKDSSQPATCPLALLELIGQN